MRAAVAAVVVVVRQVLRLDVDADTEARLVVDGDRIHLRRAVQIDDPDAGRQRAAAFPELQRVVEIGVQRPLRVAARGVPSDAGRPIVEDEIAVVVAAGQNRVRQRAGACSDPTCACRFFSVCDTSVKFSRWLTSFAFGPHSVASVPLGGGLNWPVEVVVPDAVGVLADQEERASSRSSGARRKNGRRQRADLIVETDRVLARARVRHGLDDVAEQSGSGRTPSTGAFRFSPRPMSLAAHVGVDHAEPQLGA